jgi:hypothetical protein
MQPCQARIWRLCQQRPLSKFWKNDLSTMGGGLDRLRTHGRACIVDLTRLSIVGEMGTQLQERSHLMLRTARQFGSDRDTPI